MFEPGDLDIMDGTDEAVRAALGPDSGTDKLKPLDAGFSSWILASDRIIVRIPKDRKAADRQAAMTSTLPVIAPLIPITVPRFLATIPPSPALPFGASVLARIPGVPMRTGHAGRAVVEALGRFLVNLHAIRPARLSVAVRCRADVDEARDIAMTTALPFLHTALSPPDYDRIVSWWTSYTVHRKEARFTSSLVHGDLWYGNILVDPAHSRITGILDWEEMASDDPAQDFATLRHSGNAFSDDVLDAYARAGGPVDDALLTRREWHWQAREIIGIATAIATGDESEIDDTLRKLTNGPVLSSKRPR